MVNGDASRLRVVLVHPGAGQPGGVSTDVDALARGLEIGGDEVSVVGSLPSARRALTAGTDVVHAFGCLPSATTFGSMHEARRRGIPVVWTPVFHPSRPRSWKGYGWKRAMAAFDRVAPRYARRTDVVLASTDEEVALFRRLGAPRVELIPPAVDLDLPEPTPADVAAFRERSHIPVGPMVLVVGRESSRKDLPFAVAVHERVRSLLPGTQLVLAGPSGPTGPGIVPLGWLSSSDLACAYRIADAVFVSSRYESFSRVVIEAWTHARPVVVTDRVGLARVVDGAGGVVVRHDDVEAAAEAIVSIILDRARADGLGAAGRVIARSRYELRAVVEATRAVYLASIGRREVAWTSR